MLGPWAFISNFNSGTVSVIDTVTQNFVRVNNRHPHNQQINVGSTPYKIAITNDGKYLYVIKPNDTKVSKVDRTTFHIDEIDLFSYPLDIAITGNDKKAYTASPNNEEVSVIDLATNNVNKIPMVIVPDHIVMVPDSKYAYVSGGGGPNTYINIIDTLTDKIYDKIPGTNNRDIGNMVLTKNGKYLFITDRCGNCTLVYDKFLHQISNNIAVDNDPWNIALSRDDKYAYVSHSRYIDILDTSLMTLIHKIDLGYGTNPFKIIFSLDNSKAFVTGESSVYVINTVNLNAPIHQISHLGGVLNMVLTPDGRYLYVTAYDNQGKGWVRIIDTHMRQMGVIKSLEVGDTPYYITIG